MKVAQIYTYVLDKGYNVSLCFIYYIYHVVRELFAQECGT